jgi:hypothetical protein
VAVDLLIERVAHAHEERRLALHVGEDATDLSKRLRDLGRLPSAQRDLEERRAAAFRADVVEADAVRRPRGAQEAAAAASHRRSRPRAAPGTG